LESGRVDFFPGTAGAARRSPWKGTHRQQLDSPTSQGGHTAPVVAGGLGSATWPLGALRFVGLRDEKKKQGQGGQDWGTSGNEKRSKSLPGRLARSHRKPRPTKDEDLGDHFAVPAVGKFPHTLYNSTVIAAKLNSRFSPTAPTQGYWIHLHIPDNRRPGGTA